MDREQARRRRKELGEAFLGAWGIAIIPNVLRAFEIEPDGWAWTVLRLTLATIALVFLTAWIVALVRERRMPRSTAAQTS